MSNPTRQETINTHETVNILPPESQPTMAEIKWDDNKHCLTEAEYVNGGTVIMLVMHKECDEIKCLTTADDSFRIVHLRPKHLIPTGKRYILAEVEV